MVQKARGARHGKTSKKALVTAAAVTGGVLAAAGAAAFDVYDNATPSEPGSALTKNPSLAAAVAPNPTPNPLFAVAEPIVAPDLGGLGVGGGAAPAAVDPAPAPPADAQNA